MDWLTDEKIWILAWIGKWAKIECDGKLYCVRFGDLDEHFGKPCNWESAPKWRSLAEAKHWAEVRLRCI